MKSLEQIKFDEAERAKSRRMPAGRPRSEFPERYQLRCTVEQFKAWMVAAERDGRPLQNWIRWTLDKAAARKKP